MSVSRTYMLPNARQTIAVHRTGINGISVGVFSSKSHVARNVKDINAMCSLAESEVGRASLVAAGACGALVEALKIAKADATRCNIANAVANFVDLVGTWQSKVLILFRGGLGFMV